MVPKGFRGRYRGSKIEDRGSKLTLPALYPLSSIFDPRSAGVFPDPQPLIPNPCSSHLRQFRFQISRRFERTNKGPKTVETHLCRRSKWVSRRSFLDRFRQAAKTRSGKNPRRISGFSRWERAIFKSLAVVFIVKIAKTDPNHRHYRGMRSKLGSTLMQRENRGRNSEPTTPPRDTPKIWK